jgi:acetyl esterase/lipase
VETASYRPGLDADVFVPDQRGAVPLVVMVPGGGWLTADRSGLTPLAERLAADGIFVVNATYRAAEASVVYPTPVQDVLCALGFAVDRVEHTGRAPAAVVLLGHSAGAHLAALAALGAVQRAPGCEFPLVAPDGFAGLAGVYDLSRWTALVEPLIGATPGEAPVVWRDANPLTWVTNRPSLSVFLAHGETDELVPVGSSKGFGTSLEQAGHAVRVQIVAGADHNQIYQPENIAEPLEAWVGTLKGGQT